MQFNDFIMQMWDGNDIVLSYDEGKSFLNDERLDAEGIVISIEGDKIKFSKKNNVPSCSATKHTYQMPPFAENVKALMKNACNIMLTGPMGTGKTEFVYELCKECDFSKVYQVNGSEDLTPMDFYGSMAVAVDPTTNQNYTKFDKGALYRAFIEGTQVDAEGNQILDAEGNPIVIGKPAIFFLDEFAAMLPSVLLGVFNRVLEIPRNGGSRSMEIPADNGRVVKSHPGMVIILSGNTVGTGNVGDFQVSYTAQSSKMDESTLNRVVAGFKFGYNKKAELDIALANLNDDYEVERLMMLRDKMRDMSRNQKIERIFSTRTLVSIIKVAVQYRTYCIKNWITDAIRDAVFNALSDADKQAWSETCRMIYGRDLLAEEKKVNNDYDFF